MKTTLNKIKMIVITLVCVIFGALFFINGNSEVKAETSVTLNTTDTETEYAYAVFSTTEELNYVQTVIGKSAPEVSGAEKYLFAGWYLDKKCTNPVKKYDASISTYYAKYIPEEVLGVKAQISLIAGNNEENKETRNIRFVSSVDNLSYNKVGFKLECNEQTVYNNSKTVFKRIDSATEGDEYTYSPKVVDTDSEYFITAVYPDVTDFNTGFYVRAYIKTLDGVVVYGPSRYVRVSDSLTGSESFINMPVKDTKGVITGDSVNVTYNGNTVSASVLQPESKDADDSYAHILIDLKGVKKDALKSVTTFNVGGVEAEYRNLFTTHVVAGDATKINVDDSWYDSNENEHIIATSADLYGFAELMKTGTKFAKHTVYVVCDIEANTSDSKYEWPVGNTDAHAFSGVFDGQMHIISGLYQTGKSYSGMFTVVTNTAIIKNFSLTDSLFENVKANSGSVAGRVQGGKFESIYSDADVTGSSTSIGGLIGQHQRGKSALTMTNCWFAGSVTNGNQYTGGLIGNALSPSTITNCLNTGTIHGTKTSVGGFAGNVDDKTVELFYCLNNGTVTSDATSGIGAIAGTLTATNSQGAVDCKNAFISEKCSVMVNNDKVEGVTPVKTTSVVGIKALTESTKTLFSYINEETQAYESYWAIVPNGAPVLASFAEFANAMPVDTSWYNQAEGTEDNPYILKDASDLYGLALLSKTNNFEKKTLKLGADITINEGTPDEWTTETSLHNWLPIGTEGKKFAGKFDGQMHSINGMYMNADDDSYVGMFSYTNSYAKIKNLKLMNSSFETTKGAIGSIAGYGYGTFDTIYSDAKVTGGSYAIGGLIGQTHHTSSITMNNCWFDGAVIKNSINDNTSWKASVGGLLGLAYNQGTITNCLNTGSVSVAYNETDPCVGGLVGRVYEGKTMTMKHCFDAGSVSAEGATSACGPVIGNVDTSEKTTISTTFAYTENYVENASATYSGVTNISKDTVNGTDALKNMKNIFTYTVSTTEYESYWAVVLNGAPVLESFAEETDKEFLAIDTSWYNGSGNYTLKDVSDLYGFTMLSSRINFAGETVSLSKNIDSIVINDGIPQTESWNPKYEWISVGSVDKPFAGTFNGNMKSIEGVYLQGDTNIGLFSTIIGDSVIQNLSLKHAYMNLSTGNQNGSIVGRSYGGTLDTVYSDAIIVGSGYNIGGLVGRVEKNSTKALTLNNCWFDGKVTNDTTSGYGTGGLIGNVLNDVTVTNCLNSGDISMPKYTKNEGTADTPVVRPRIGGFTGNIEAEVEIETNGEKVTKETSILFSHCFNSGIITYNNVTGITGFGTFVGYTPKTSVCFQDSYSTIENGLSSYSRGGATSILSNCNRFSKSELYGTKAFDKVGVLFEANENENYRIYWGIVENGTPVLSSFAENAENDAIAINTNWYDANKDSYTLNHAGDLYGFALISDKAAIAGYAGKTITLGQDITINKGTAADWATVAPQFKWGSICTNGTYRFQGTFEGNGKTISGLYLDEKATYRGFFGYTDNGSVVRNFRIVNSFFNNTAQAIGSVAGNGRGSFDAIYSDAIVVGANSNVGGLIGQISGTGVVITNCWFDGTVTNNSAEKQSTGGIVGAANVSLTLENCLNTGAVSAPNYEKYDEGTTDVKPLIGGLIGYATPTGEMIVQHCLNTGKVSFNNKATAGFGSIIGRIGSLGDATLGTIMVNNTYATDQSCWETISTGVKELPLNVEVVDANVLSAENATEILAGLFDDSLTTNWVAVENGAVLKEFAEYTIEGRSVSALHQWVTSSDALTVTIANPTRLPNPNQSNSTFFRQGGYTDGEYFYQAYITSKDENDETNNKVKVLKYHLETGATVWSDELALRHANDVTFNTKLGYLVVCHGDKKISYFSVTEDSLDYVETVELSASISRIDYNEERDVYVTGTSETLYLLNSDLSRCSTIHGLPAAPTGGARQAVSCDEDYIYYAITDGHSSGDKVEKIEVYNWNGILITTVTVTVNSKSHVIEFENISVVGDKIYIMAAEYSELFDYQLDKPANVYVIDLSTTK